MKKKKKPGWGLGRAGTGGERGYQPPRLVTSLGFGFAPPPSSPPRAGVRFFCFCDYSFFSFSLFVLFFCCFFLSFFLFFGSLSLEREEGGPPPSLPPPPPKPKLIGGILLPPTHSSCCSAGELNSGGALRRAARTRNMIGARW